MRTEPRFAGSLKGLIPTRFGPLNNPDAQRHFQAMQTILTDPQLAQAIADADRHVVVELNSLDDMSSCPDTGYVHVYNALTQDEFQPLEHADEAHRVDYTNPQSARPGLVRFILRAVHEASAATLAITALDKQLKKLRKGLKLKGLSSKKLEARKGRERDALQAYLTHVLSHPEVEKAFQSAPSPYVSFTVSKRSSMDLILGPNLDNVAQCLKPFHQGHPKYNALKKQFDAITTGGFAQILDLSRIYYLDHEVKHPSGPEYYKPEGFDAKTALAQTVAHERKKIVEYVNLWNRAMREELGIAGPESSAQPK